MPSILVSMQHPKAEKTKGYKTSNQGTFELKWRSFFRICSHSKTWLIWYSKYIIPYTSPGPQRQKRLCPTQLSHPELTSSWQDIKFKADQGWATQLHKSRTQRKCRQLHTKAAMTKQTGQPLDTFRPSMHSHIRPKSVRQTFKLETHTNRQLQCYLRNSY